MTKALPPPLPPPRPTAAELAILRVLWARGPSTVRDVHSALESRGTGYTTVLKLMQIMEGKGVVSRDESQRSHVYKPLVSEEQTRADLVLDVMEKAFAGSASQLVMSALASKRASREELAEIRAMIEKLEKRGDR